MENASVEASLAPTAHAAGRMTEAKLIARAAEGRKSCAPVTNGNGEMRNIQSLMRERASYEKSLMAERWGALLVMR